MGICKSIRSYLKRCTV